MFHEMQFNAPPLLTASKEGMPTTSQGIFQIIGRIFVEHETLSFNLDGHEIATPNIFGFRQVGIRNLMFFQRLRDVCVQDWAFLRQQAGKINGVGLVVGNHNKTNYTCSTLVKLQKRSHLVLLPALSY